MKSIFCSPFTLSNNKYIDMHKAIWRAAGYRVNALNFSMLNALFQRQNNIAIFSWLEDSLIKQDGRAPLLTFIKKLTVLLIAKCCCTKVVWIKHNLKPHALTHDKPFLLRVFERLYLKLADIMVVHADTVALHPHQYVIPHPLYQEYPMPPDQADGGIIEFLFFGVITRYKNLENLLTIWPVDQRLTLAGRCKDPALKYRLTEIIQQRELTVDWLDRFIQDDELHQLLSRTKTVVLPHAPGTMIVSGAFYHAISYGCQVMMMPSDFYQYLNRYFPYVYAIDEQLADTMVKISSMDNKTQVLAKAIHCFGENEISHDWEKLLG